MKLAIDAREAFAAQRAGKGSWTAGFIEQLQQRDEEIILLTDSPREGCIALAPGVTFHTSIGSYVCDNAIDVFVSPTSFIAPALLGTRIPVIPVVHDMIAFRGEPHDRKATIIEKLFLPRAVKHAAHICTVSNTTKRDLTERFPALQDECVTPIFAGPMQEHVQLSQPDNKTILCVGTLCPRKNQKQLIAAYASLPDSLRSQYRLVLVGARGWHDEDIVRYAQNTKGVEWKDYVSDEEYRSLLSTATIFAYPSLYEGFGMQVLDAMQRGIPVLTSDRGSLAEVVGSSAFTVNPESELSIVEGLRTLLSDERLRTSLRTEGPKAASRFSWQQTVDIFLEVARKCVYYEHAHL